MGLKKCATCGSMNESAALSCSGCAVEFVQAIPEVVPVAKQEHKPEAKLAPKLQPAPKKPRGKAKK